MDTFKYFYIHKRGPKQRGVIRCLADGLFFIYVKVGERSFLYELKAYFEYVEVEEINCRYTRASH